MNIISKRTTGYFIVIMILTISLLLSFFILKTIAENSPTYILMGDGVTDDSAALKGIIATIEEGGTISLDKVYNLNKAAINISKPIKIIGTGKIINANFYINNASNVEFSGLDTDNVCIVVTNSSNVKISNNKFKNIKADVAGAIEIKKSCSNVEIKGNKFSEIKYITSSTTYGCGIKMDVTDSQLSGISIKDNWFDNIHGPAVIWIGGSNSSFSNFLIDNNDIQDTESFGIEFFRYQSAITFTECYVTNNRLLNIGSVRANKTGVGCGGIYSNAGEGIYVEGNDIRHATEVGIEGYYSTVKNNYIEDTGCDQLNRPINDDSGIYNGGKKVTGNTIVNPGHYGGIHLFSADKISNHNYQGNIIRNEYDLWKAETIYSQGDTIVANDKWYTCMKTGRSGSNSPSEKIGNIVDGDCIWDYKKMLSKDGIHLNGVKKIENVSITDNNVTNFENFIFRYSEYYENFLIDNNMHNGIEEYVVAIKVPEVIPPVVPEIIPPVEPEIIPPVVPEVIPPVVPEVIPPVVPEVIPPVVPEVIPPVVPEVIPPVVPEVDNTIHIPEPTIVDNAAVIAIKDENITDKPNKVTRVSVSVVGLKVNKDKLAVVYENKGARENILSYYKEKTNEIEFNARLAGNYRVSESNIVFEDVEEGNWAKPYIEKMARQGIVKGKSLNKFFPEENVTRAEFATTLVRLLGLEKSSEEATFSDVKSGDWYYDTISIAVKVGLIQGVGDNKFEPNNPITREQMALITARALKLLGKTSVNGERVNFTDTAELPAESKEALDECIRYGVIIGKPGNVFEPRGVATRASAAKVLCGVYGILGEK